MQGISAGKLRNILHLADEHGCFRMMAIDQRSSMRRMIAKQLTKGEDDVTYDEIALAKYYITKLLSPYSSATLTDPIYGYPNCIAVIPRDVGVLIAYEESPPPKTESGERLLKLINGWSVEKTKRAGANAVKLLVYYNPYASESTREQTHEVVRQVGDECERYDIPYLLEIVVYPLAGV
ncbi:MAG TPA: hypothetical protein EYP10_03315, partial [Armatimonadetes bacterium]|nr:hypothetical protein [Armatimonadota bacterium]